MFKRLRRTYEPEKTKQDTFIWISPPNLKLKMPAKGGEKSKFKRKGRRKEGKKNRSVVSGLVWQNEMVLTKLSYDADGAGTWHLEK